MTKKIIGSSTSNQNQLTVIPSITKNRVEKKLKNLSACSNSQCPECQAAFYNAQGRNNHLEEFHPESPYLAFHCKLNSCTRKFTTEKGLNFHMSHAKAHNTKNKTAENHDHTKLDRTNMYPNKDIINTRALDLAIAMHMYKKYGPPQPIEPSVYRE
jgi:hypothetical protein